MLGRLKPCALREVTALFPSVSGPVSLSSFALSPLVLMVSIMSRPPVDDLDRRHPFSGLRLSVRERNSIRARSAEAGMSVSSFIRQSALSATVRAAPAVSIRQWSELAPLASNLNQIAHRLNAGGQNVLTLADRQAIAGLDDLLREIRLRLVDVEPDP